VRGFGERAWLSSGPLQVFDRRSKVRHKIVAACADDADEYDYLKDEVAERMVDRMSDVSRTFEKALDIGCGSGAHVAHAIARTLPKNKVKELIQTDVAEEVLARAKRRCEANDIPCREFRVMDEENIPFEHNQFDVVTSSLALHWVNDLPGSLVQINRILKPDGLFLGAMFGGETLSELRISMQLAEEEIWNGISPHVSPLARIRDAGSVLGRGGFVLTAIDTDDIIVQFQDLPRLMKHLKGMGENNAAVGRRTYFGRRAFQRTSEIYKEQFRSPDGDGILATFQVIYMIGWKQSESQPRALERGSATARLKDLGEISELIKAEQEKK